LQKAQFWGVFLFRTVVSLKYSADNAGTVRTIRRSGGKTYRISCLQPAILNIVIRKFCNGSLQNYFVSHPMTFHSAIIIFMHVYKMSGHWDDKTIRKTALALQQPIDIVFKTMA
jgi:hypothetical protein